MMSFSQFLVIQIQDFYGDEFYDYVVYILVDEFVVDYCVLFQCVEVVQYEVSGSQQDNVIQKNCQSDFEIYL